MDRVVHFEGVGVLYKGVRVEDNEVGGVVNTLGVPSFDEYAKKITAAGGKALTPKTAVPHVGYFAYFKDTEGNTFGVMENDERAR